VKKEDHQKITALAIDLCCSHLPQASMFFDKKKEIINGSEDADTSPVYTRLTNWHFFKANDLLQPSEFKILGCSSKVYPTSDAILAYRIMELRRELQQIQSATLFDIIGRILHHIQDMSTPSHVVPVYHGGKPHDEYENVIADHSEGILASLSFAETELASIVQEPSHDLMQIYTTAAHRTLEDLRQPFAMNVSGAPVEGHWQLFWQGYKETGPARKKIFQGFGSFGPLGPKYGRRKMTVAGVKFVIEPEVYQEQMTRMLRNAVLDSFRALCGIYPERLNALKGCQASS